MKARSWWIVELVNGRTMLHGTRTGARKAMAHLREHGLRGRIIKVVEAKAGRARRK